MNERPDPAALIKNDKEFNMPAQGRILLNTISKSKKLASLKTDSARLLYTWLLSHLDKNGNFNGDPYLVKAYVVPMLTHITAKTVLTDLDDLESAGLLNRYDVRGEIYIHYPDFVERQPSLRPDKEKTQIPIHPKKVYESVAPPVHSPSIARPRTGEDKIREEKLNEDKRNEMKRNFSLFVDSTKAEMIKAYEHRGYGELKLKAFDMTLLKMALKEGIDVCAMFIVYLDKIVPGSDKEANIKMFFSQIEKK